MDKELKELTLGELASMKNGLERDIKLTVAEFSDKTGILPVSINVKGSFRSEYIEPTLRSNPGYRKTAVIEVDIDLGLRI